MKPGLAGRILVTWLAPAALLAVLSLRHEPGHDYLPMHAAALLLRTGENPYHLGGLQRVEAALRAADPALYEPGEFIAYYYPPWLALACVPLTALGYPAAKAVWVFLAYQSLVLAGLTLRALPGRPSRLAIVLGLLAVPACLAAHLGQTSAQVLVLLALAWRWIDRGWDTRAGVALAWLTVKPQMTVLVIPAVLIWSARHGRWKVLWSFAAMLGVLCAGCALLVPSWPWDLIQAPRLSPLPSATHPSDGVTWLAVLQTLGLKRWPLVLAYAALALPVTATALRVAADRARSCADVVALGAVAAFFTAPHSLGYDFAILLFPLLVFLTGLSRRRTIEVLLGVTIGFNLHFNLIQGGTTRLALVSLFWLPAGLAIWGFARAAGEAIRHGDRDRDPDQHETAVGHPGLRADHAPGPDPGPARLGPERAARAGQP